MEIDDGAVYRLASGELLEVMLVRGDGMAEVDVVTWPGLPALRQVEIPVAELAALEHLPAERFAWSVRD
jgi:hypothetical protein